MKNEDAQQIFRHHKIDCEELLILRVIGWEGLASYYYKDIDGSYKKILGRKKKIEIHAAARKGRYIIFHGKRRYLK